MKRLVVLGGGESGYGSAILGKVVGFDVFLSDFGRLGDRYRTALDSWSVVYEEGGHTENLIMNADLVVKSPGIPDTAPMVTMLRDAGVEIISEIEFAGRYTKARSVCITGSNGKTTTTTLTYEILRDAGFCVALGGNIGESFAYNVALQLAAGHQIITDTKVDLSAVPSAVNLSEVAPIDWYVLELSSFQLDGTYSFRADIGILMNITPDHLDRYDYNMQNYVDSKFRILRNQTANDYFIYCGDDPTINGELHKYDLKMRCAAFGSKTTNDAAATYGAHYDGRNITCRISDAVFEIDFSTIHLKGLHNAYNTMASSLAALAAGVSPDSLSATLQRFRGVEHRLEYVCEIDGVSYINDSKATNVDSVWYALESMTRPVIWIAGGTDKGNDYAPLYDFARAKVKALVCMGLDNSKLKSSFADIVPTIFDTSSLPDAIDAARSVSCPGDVILLSPACASFDLFRNYEDRGRQFKSYVTNTKTE